MTAIEMRSDQLSLVGFVSELLGNEDHFLKVQPVVRVGALDYVAPAENWTTDDLGIVTDELRRFVNYLHRPDYRVIQPGDVVWLAGGNFVLDMQRIAARSGAFRIGGWPLFGPGFRWSSGPPRRFDELSMQLAQHLELALHEALFDALEKSHGDAKSIARLYEVLSIPRSVQRETNLGLYYFEMRDTHSYDLVRYEAVLAGVFQSEERFDQEVQALRAQLASNRLSESTFAGSELPVMDLFKMYRYVAAGGESPYFGKAVYAVHPHFPMGLAPSDMEHMR